MIASFKMTIFENQIVAVN